jgi:hypothetical protein
MSAPDFFLASTEGYGLTEPRRCWVERQLRIGADKHGLLVRVEPPIVVRNVGDVPVVVLVSRHLGETLNPVSSWPAYVHVARPLKIIEGDSMAPKELENVAWAELYQTEDAARTKQM